ncbi:hypothetical protein HAX54_013350, partial [Datura stramonium]|nr:hypothetical protein [Datura stramonium]
EKLGNNENQVGKNTVQNIPVGSQPTRSFPRRLTCSNNVGNPENWKGVEANLIEDEIDGQQNKDKEEKKTQHNLDHVAREVGLSPKSQAKGNKKNKGKGSSEVP